MRMKKNILIILGIIIFAICLENILASTSMFKHLELMSYDFRSKFDADNGVLGNKFNHADKDIVIIGIDDYSKKTLAQNSNLDLGPWPWKRDVWNNVVDFIEKGDPEAVLFDMVFEQSNENPWPDRKFAKNLRRYDNIILGTYLDNPKNSNDAFTPNSDIEYNDFLPTSTALNVKIKDKKLDDAITYYTNSPVRDIYTEHNTMGVVNKDLDYDFIVRKNRPLFKLVKNNETYYMPSLAFAGFLKYMGEDGNIVVKNHKILYKGRVIPIDNDGNVSLNWHKFGHSYSYIPISKIFLNEAGENEIKADYFKNKFVIIGKTESGKGVDLSSKLDPSFASLEADAIALDNFLNDSIPSNTKTRKFIYEIQAPIQYLLIIFACVIVGLVSWFSKNALIGAIRSVILIALYILLCFWCFVNPSTRIWIPIFVPLYYLLFTSCFVFAFKFYKEIKQKIFLMSVFGKNISPEKSKNLLENPNKVVLKNTKKHMTVLYCEVNDFTSLSEKYNTEKLMTDLNELFKEIVDIIFENNGTVDKFIGNSIMAYWSADELSSNDNAFWAVKTALEIKKKVNEIKVKNAKENKIIIDVTMGINTGDALLGLVGPDKIMSYTAMGETLNVASHLKELAYVTLNKPILISESTYKEAKDKIITLDVCEISVKGKIEKMKIYEPIGLADEDKINESI